MNILTWIMKKMEINIPRRALILGLRKDHTDIINKI